MKKNKLFALSGVALLLAGAAACSSTPQDSAEGSTDDTASSETNWQAGSRTPEPFDGRPDVTDFCPEEPMKVGFADTNTGNAWKQIVGKIIEVQASQCDTIEEVILTDAGGSPEKFNSDINGMIAQGVGAIVAFNEFGEAALPTLRAAANAGIPLVATNVDPSGEIGVDYVDFIAQDYAGAGAGWADWAAEQTDGQGGVVMLGGVAGNPQSIAFWDGFKERAASEYPDLNILEDQPVTTEWTLDGIQQATSGLISQYGDDIDVIVNDFNAGFPAIVRAYEAASMDLPYVAGLALTNEAGCLVNEVLESQPDFKFQSYDQTPRMGEISLRRALAAATGKDNPESSIALLTPSWIDTTEDPNVPCNTDLPPDADLSSGLSDADLAELFG